MTLHSMFKRCVPTSIIGLLRYYFTYKVPANKRKYKGIVNRVSEKNHANVFFIISSLSMWRSEGLLELLLQDPRFSVKVLIYPFITYNDESRKKEYAKIIEYFDNKGIEILRLDSSEEYVSIKKECKPDIIFYPQPYDDIYGNGNEMDWKKNLDCLIAYEPYFLNLASGWWAYNLPFHLLAWKHYQPSQMHVELANKIAYNHGENLVVVGEPRADELNGYLESDPWKKVGDGNIRKRIIWAPHYQISEGSFIYRPDFLWAGEAMLEIAKQYSDKIQLAFKPHPKLKTKLYNHPDWGKKRTDDYYHQWETLPNTQISDGEYTDLFKGSDAMIHNSGSFTGEYLFVRKPVALLTRSEENQRKTLNKFGNRCMDGHYILSSVEEIYKFIDDIVVCGKDNLKQRREDIYKEQMQPPYSRSTAENIYNDLVESLKLR